MIDWMGREILKKLSSATMEEREREDLERAGEEGPLL
jgi:hypothetical protein